MIIEALTAGRAGNFAALFLPYFQELESQDSQPMPPHVITDRITPFVLGQWKKGIIRIDLCISEDTAIGFVLYQIDSPESDWCKRPGWGFIREFYVVPEHRRHGIGRALARHAEQALKGMGTTQVYLQSETPAFWLRCGYLDENPDAPGSHMFNKTL